MENPQPDSIGDSPTHNLSGVYKLLEVHLRRRSLWTRDMVDEMHRLARDLPSLKPGDSYRVPTFHNPKQTYSFQIPRFNPKTQYLSIEIVGHHDLSKNINDNGEYISQDPSLQVPYHVQIRGRTRHRIEKECFPEPGKGPSTWPKGEPWSTWKGEWESGRWAKYSAQLKGLISDSWPTLRSVDRIVCIGLGSLQTGVNMGSITRQFPRPYVQHLAADTIRTTLHQLTCEYQAKVRHEYHAKVQQGKGKGKAPMISMTPPKPLPIFAQDPEYCKQCKKALWDTLDIQAYSDCTGFRAITGNTLVMCIAPSGPLVGLICDITQDFKGPLAMLCNEIDLETPKWDGIQPVDAWLKWDQWDGKRRSGQNDHGNWTKDHPTRNMVKYANRCHSEYFGDFQDCYEIPYTEHRRTTWDLPYPGEIRMNREKFPPGRNGDEEYKKKYGREYSEHFAAAERAVKPKAKPNFGDLRFYVRR